MFLDLIGLYYSASKSGAPIKSVIVPFNRTDGFSEKSQILCQPILKNIMALSKSNATVAGISGFF